MKKMTLLFLALSAVAFGAASTTKGANKNNHFIQSGEKYQHSASVDVHVSAFVNDSAPDFIITDAYGSSIASIDFRHELNEGTLAGQAEQNLTAYIRASGAGLSESSTGNLSTAFGSESLTLSNGANTLTSTLTATKNGFDKYGAILNVNSSLSLNEGMDLTSGTYASQTTTLTITYNKSTN